MRVDLKPLLTPRWIITTLLVIIAVGVMIRLGFWQLDRLRQRRAFNAQVEAQINAPQLNLNAGLVYSGLQPDQLTGMEYHPVIASGTFDPQNQVVLRNQVNGDMPGYHLLTPFHIEGTNQSVLVDRGFIPMEDSQPSDWAKYNVSGNVTVKGIIRLGHVPQFFGVRDPALATGQTRLDAWNAINLPRIAQQTPYPLLPVYIQAAPGPNNSTAPIASIDQPDLSDGPHLSYAIQWFSFAAILACGYPFFVRKQLKEKK